MSRVVLLQADSRFEKYLDVALRTWLAHNDKSKWTFLLLDLGLSPQHVEKYKSLCRIERVNNDPRWGRFIHAAARLEYMRDLCMAGHTVFQLDADTMSLDSMESWISDFEASPHEFSAVSEFPHHLFMQFNSWPKGSLEGMIRDHPKLGEATFSSPSFNFGLVMLKGKKAADLCSSALDIMKHHEKALPWAEQSAFNAAFYAAGAECMVVGRIWNYMLNIHQLRVLQDWNAEAIDNAEEKIKIVHYAGHDQKISPHGPYAPHEQLWLYWAINAPLFEDLK